MGAATQEAAILDRLRSEIMAIAPPRDPGQSFDCQLDTAGGVTVALEQLQGLRTRFFDLAWSGPPADAGEAGLEDVALVGQARLRVVYETHGDAQAARAQAFEDAGAILQRLRNPVSWADAVNTMAPRGGTFADARRAPDEGPPDSVVMALDFDVEFVR